MSNRDTPPVVRDGPSLDRGPDLASVGTDLVICDGEVMTYAEYRRRRDAGTTSRSREAAVDRRGTRVEIGQ